jgi:hypothetical protein
LLCKILSGTVTGKQSRPVGAFQILGRREKIGHNPQEVPDETLTPAKESGFDE